MSKYEKYNRRILSEIMEFIKSEDLSINDDFPIEVANCYFSLILENLEVPSKEIFYQEVNKIKTSFFKINLNIIKKEFCFKLREHLTTIGNIIISNKNEIKNEISVVHPQVIQLYIDNIESFTKVKNINPTSVFDSVPLDLPEDDIKKYLTEILEEKFIPKHWGGEKSDLFTSRVLFNGNRINTAFLLKGRSIRKLTISKLGTQGNQILRLTKEPANLFIVQHVGEISPDVIEHLENELKEQCKKRGITLYYCIIDGVDTARILKAYRKIK